MPEHEKRRFAGTQAQASLVPTFAVGMAMAQAIDPADCAWRQVVDRQPEIRLPIGSGGVRQRARRPERGCAVGCVDPGATRG